jgi:L-ascorbate metabolism protein UlaG (beta-lactamase superfamily)
VTQITFLGHATVLVAMGGVRLLTDPLLRRRVAHLRRRDRVEPPADIDAVLISHGHYDHLDLRSLELVGRSTRVVVPHGLGELLRGRGFDRVEEVDVGERVSFDEVTVEATYADHDGRRRPLGARGPALGYLISGSERVYFAGDTDLFEGMASIGQDLEVALLPVWGWGPTLGSGHLDPTRAAEALALLRPRVAVPIHWGTYRPFHVGLRVAPVYLRNPPGEFERAAAKVAPEVDVRVLQPGESLELDPLARVGF